MNFKDLSNKALKKQPNEIQQHQMAKYYRFSLALQCRNYGLGMDVGRTISDLGDTRYIQRRDLLHRTCSQKGEPLFILGNYP